MTFLFYLHSLIKIFRWKTLPENFQRFSEIFRDSPILLSEFLRVLLDTYVILFAHSEKIRLRLWWKTRIFSYNVNSGKFRKKVICQNVLIVLLVLLAEFFWKYTIFPKKMLSSLYRQQVAHGKTVARKRGAILNFNISNLGRNIPNILVPLNSSKAIFVLRSLHYLSTLERRLLGLLGGVSQVSDKVI